MTEYNKLVRDRIPEIITAGGETAIIRTLTDEEYGNALTEKLAEEQKELAAATTREQQMEELADVQEVVLAKARQLGSVEELEAVRAKKAARRGAFELKIYLERTE